MKTRKDYWLVIIFLSKLLVAMAVFGQWPSPLRGLIVFLYILLCPGLSLAYLIPLGDFLTRFFLIIVLSISIDTLVTEAILYLGKWSPQLILVILIMICLLGTSFELFFKFRNAKLPGAS